MVKFLCVLTAVMVSVGAIAQNADSGLFPELQKRNQAQAVAETPTATTTNVSQPIPSLFDNESDEEMTRRMNENMRALLNESDDDRLSETLGRSAAQTQQRQLSKAEENSFVFTPSEIQIVVPTISRFQFCTSQLTLANNTADIALKSLGVVLTYANIKVPYTYTNLNPEDSQSGTVALGGEACQVLLKVPGVDVTKCVATRLVEKDGRKVEVPLSEDECRSKVKYIPR